MSSRPINEDDLNGFVDQRLDVARQAEVVAYLETHPDIARRVAGYCEQRDQLRAALAPVAEEPLPAELDLSRMIAARRRPSSAHAPRWAMAAAAALLISIGGAGGWMVRDMGLPSSPATGSIAREAAASYRVYASDRAHPVEIRAEDGATLAEWMERQLGRSVTAPDLAASGYRFMGGRVLPTDHGPAAMLMYDDDKGTRLVMLARPMATAGNAPMSPYSQDGVQGYAWADDGLGYSLVGPIEATKLHPIADDARRQLRHRA